MADAPLTDMPSQQGAPGGDELTFGEFFDAIYQLADHWVPSTRAAPGREYRRLYPPGCARAPPLRARACVHCGVHAVTHVED